MAKDFSFRFQSILNLKDKVEESKKNDFGNAVTKLESHKKNLNNLLNKRQEIIDELNDKSQKIVKVHEYRNICNNLQNLERNISNQNSIIFKQEVEVEKCKFALINAKKETKIFEKIKENDLSDYRYKEAKNEEMLIDHFVSYKSSRR